MSASARLRAAVRQPAKSTTWFRVMVRKGRK
jgi:hypothetical protein